MCHQDNYNPQIMFWCNFCKNPIYEGEGYIEVDGFYYHYSENSLENCYYEEEEIEE